MNEIFNRLSNPTDKRTLLAKLGAALVAAGAILPTAGCDNPDPNTMPAFAERGDTLGGTVFELCPSANDEQIFNGVEAIVYLNDMPTDRLVAGQTYIIPEDLCKIIGTKDIPTPNQWQEANAEYIG